MENDGKWKMENAHRMGHRQVWRSSGILLFRSAHLHEHEDQIPALRIASCTYTFDGWLQVLLCSLRLESSNCPERIIVRYQVHVILLCRAMLLVVVARLKTPCEWRVWL